jgi:uncharacterized membrane protein
MNEIDKNNPDLRKFGIFYYNPKDPEVLSPREGPGRTGPALNFAHKRTYLYIVLFITVIFVAGYLKNNL